MKQLVICTALVLVIYYVKPVNAQSGMYHSFSWVSCIIRVGTCMHIWPSVSAFNLSIRYIFYGRVTMKSIGSTATNHSTELCASAEFVI